MNYGSTFFMLESSGNCHPGAIIFDHPRKIALGSEHLSQKYFWHLRGKVVDEFAECEGPLFTWAIYHKYCCKLGYRPEAISTESWKLSRVPILTESGKRNDVAGVTAASEKWNEIWKRKMRVSIGNWRRRRVIKPIIGWNKRDFAPAFSPFNTSLRVKTIHSVWEAVDSQICVISV